MPILASAGKSCTVRSHLLIKTSLGSNLLVKAAKTSPLGLWIVRSLALCTAISMSPLSRDISMSLANDPLSKSFNGVKGFLSP